MNFPNKNLRIAEMYYNKSDIEKGYSALEHFTTGYFKNVASCGKKLNINNYDFVLNWVIHNDERYVQIGIPLGISPYHSSHYWRNWRQNINNNEVWKVKWIVRGIVPNSLFEGKGHLLSNEQKNDIYRYLINNISL